ncbi:hypothetical protein EG329_013640 [Mollisiaceae sp. DMI_Dod_QoI]|nr:hypothetical protein EG329_013640 [Helotiales sp. DMI_Dod_QoI]
MNSTIPSTDTSTRPDLKDSLVSESPQQPQTSGNTTSAQSRWPYPEASIGIPCCSLGTQKCWEVAGLAFRISRSLLREVKDLLDQHAPYLHNNVSKPFSITFGLFMVGKAEQEACPTLVLSCESELPRDRCLNLVRRAGILTRYQGVLLVSSTHPPTSLRRLQPPSPLAAADSEFVYFSPPITNDVCGCSIHVMERSVPRSACPTSISRKATIGGFVRLRTSEHDDIYCGLTVAHAFEDDFHLPPASPWMDFAFDGADPLQGKDDLGDVIMGERYESNTHLVEHASQLSNMIEVLAERSYTDSIKEMEGHGIGSQLASSLNGQRPDLDWALIEIQHPHHEPANITSINWVSGQCQLYVERIVATIKETVNVLVVTSIGIQTGFLSASSMFYKSPHGVSSEEVYVVRVDGKFERGDMGCWVIDPEHGDLYGHIIACSPDIKVGYLVPAFRIFNDIKEQLGGSVELAGRTPISSRHSLQTRQLSTLLGMNQTDEEIMRLLQMSKAVFTEMAVETEVIYQALVANPSNLKQYIKKSSPYSWHDISDKAKYEAMIRLSSSTNPRTQPYWYRGAGQTGGNLLATWFLFGRSRLAGMNRQKRFGGAHPEDLDLMFIARPTSRMSNRLENTAGPSTLLRG